MLRVGNEVWEGTSYDNAAEYTAAIALDSQAVGIQRSKLSFRESYHLVTLFKP